MSNQTEFDDVIDAMHALKLYLSYHSGSAPYFEAAKQIATMLEAKDKARTKPGMCTAVANAIRTEYGLKS